ncbi:MAG: hypothetical protein HGA61_04605 [Candidatus Moranbacteria bacterium]|nr:hypothetical protein [Candidatus Moranbacteria bacterium]
METDKKKIFLNTVLWGFLLWLFGYVLGIVFFVFVPKEHIGWAILPFGVAATSWVLLKKIQRESFGCYVGLGVFWVIMALVLDYVFIVKLLKSTNYYKLDVYTYYILTFILPVFIGWKKIKKVENDKQ